MKDEIKIITLGDIFKNLETEEKAFKFKNYITNLQEELQKKEAMYDSLAVNYRLAQEENERLKKENIKLYKKDTKIINELKKELEITQEKWDKDKQFSKCRTMEMLDYKSRNEKAIELIHKLLNEEFVITDEDNIYYGEKVQRSYFSDSELGKIENILNGDDE